MYQIPQKHFILILSLDLFMLVFSWAAAFCLRFNFEIPDESMSLMLRTLPLVVPLKAVIFYFFDMYKGMWRYTGIADLYNILKSSTVSSVLIFFLIYVSLGFSGFSRSILIIDFVLTFILVSAHRVGVRLYFWFGLKDYSTRINPANLIRYFFGRHSSQKSQKRLLIIGAGDCGEKIFREINDNHQLRYRVIGFIDDDAGKINRQIHGIPVIGPIRKISEILKELEGDEILIAIPSATSKQMRDIIGLCKESGKPFKTLPGLGELINGKVTVQAIREVAYRDLLGREVIRLEENQIGGYLKGNRILVSGAGGSIGSELCRQIARFNPEKIILCDQAESALYDIDIELKKNFPYVESVPVLVDIKDKKLLSYVFQRFLPRVIFHAAAYKHVPMLEIQPWEAVANNILGTRNMVEAANRFEVSHFVFVSTDKAVRPSNVMGASKRVSELIVQSQNSCGSSNTQFITVRFGNVVGSVGSVVPLFRKQIEKGGPVTVTHPEVTRYFMTIPEACQLILQSGAMGEGGEIFILDMGTPIKIMDMAKDLIRLSGFEPEIDINIQFIGLRPGEKLYEELITEGEGILPTKHEKIMVLRGQVCDQLILKSRIDRLVDAYTTQDIQAIKERLMEIVPEYTPSETCS